jgi:hypothetical protein
VNLQTLLKGLTARPVPVVVAALTAVVALLVVTRCGGGDNTGGVPQVRAGRTVAATTPAPAAKTNRHADPTTPADDAGDDGVADTPAASALITSGPVDPGEAGMQFLATWLTTYGKTPAQWRESLHPLVTAQLWDLLTDADPATLPQGKLVGPAQVKPAGDLLAVVSVAINRGTHGEIPNGTVTVTMTARSHRWLAAQLDWTVTR